MTVYIRNGGVWRAGSNGGIKIKWSGAWRQASYVYIKSGGAWRDSGYRGYPNPPQSIWVHGWDFSNVALSWSGPAAGGAPVVSYQVAARDSNGNGIGQPDYDNVQPPWGNFAVGQDGLYQYYVRSKTAAGLYSSWTGPVRVRIGHTETGYYATENRTRGWQSGSVTGYRNRDEPFWATVPGNVLLTGMHWRNMGTPQSSVVAPGTNRTVYWNFNGSDWSPITDNLGTVYTGNSTDFGFNNQGDGRPWGVVPRGAGWSTTGNSYYMIYVDEFHLSGTETYQVSVYYITRNYAGNSYW